MFAHALKPAGRFVSGATLMATAATVLALLPATAAHAAGTVSAANPAVLDNVGTPTVTFTTSDTFNAALPMTVSITGPGGAGTYDGSNISATGNTVTATFTFPASLPAGPGQYTAHICQSIGSNCAPNADDSSNGPILTVNAGAHPLGVTGLSNDVRATDADPTATFTVNGVNFASGDTVSFVPTHNGDTAPTLGNLTVTNSQISGKFPASGAGSLANATPGIYDTVVTHTDGTTSPISQSDQLAVVNPPSITAVDPAPTVGIGAGQNGHAARTITLHVTALTSNAASLSFPANATDGLAVTVQSVTAESNPSIMDVVAAITTSASTTAQSVPMTLTDPVSGGTATQSITVDPAPAITAASSSVGQGAQAKSVTFTGTGLDSKAALSFPAAAKVTLGTQTLDQPNQTITVPVTVDPSAPTGKVGFSVVNGDGGATDYTGGSSGNSVFSVNPAPVLGSASPASVPLGSTTTVTLNGSGFTSNMTIAPTNQNSGVQFSNLNVPSGSTTQATVHVAVASNAPTGGIAITLANPDGGTSNSVGKLAIDSFGVSGVSPTSASNGGSGSNAVAITVTGANIPTTGTTTLQLTRLPDSSSDTTSVPPITVSPSSTPTSTTWHGTANLVGAAAGNYQVQLVNGSATGTCTCQFTITSAASPTISSVSPTAVGQGATTTLVVNGTGFTQGAQITFSKVNSADAITATGPTVFDSTTKLEVPIQVASNAPAASKIDVTETNPGAAPSGGTNTATKTGAITINAAPAITSFSPAALAQGAVTTLTINGTGFDSTTATVTFGTGITQGTGAVTTTSTQIKIPVKVDQSAPGSVAVTVKNGDGGTGSKNITVNAGPKIASIKPQYVAKDFSGTLTISGSGYHSGATVSFPSGSNVATTGNATVSTDGTTITIPIKVTRTDAAQVDVTVTNSDDLGSATLAKGLGVSVAPADPTNAAAARSGSAVTVSWTAVPASADGGAPITGYTVSVTSPTGTGLSNQTTTGTSVTFNGLSTSTDYTFKIVATNAAGLSSPGATASTTGVLGGTTLTLISTAGRRVAGQAVSLGGSLASGKGDPIGGATITVTARLDGGQVFTAAGTTTASDGTWIVSLRPTHNATYTAKYAGGAQFASATSPSGRVVVAPKVTIAARQKTSHTRKLVVTGHVSPSKAGRFVHLTAVSSHGVRKTFAARLSSGSSYRFAVKLGKGKWTLVVRIARTSGNVAGQSSRKTVTRT